jgi:hypothetical protein
MFLSLHCGTVTVLSTDLPADAKFLVKIYPSPKPKKVPKVVSTELKGGASPKMIGRMKKESVDCPMVNKEVAFLVCFACPSFVRRVSGMVHCAGIQPPPKEWLLP